MANKKASEVIAVCNKYVGTKESPANSNNVIFNTHYYGKPVSGSAYPWCAVFLWDCFRMAGASNLFYGGQKCAYTPTLANYYKSIKRWYTSPKVGDLVFFQFPGSNRINHIGIVIGVLGGGVIKTIEGNTGSTSQANGGCVEIKQRSSSIAGYGRPLYGAETGSTSATKDSTKKDSSYSLTDFIKEVQTIVGLSPTGKANTTLLNKTVTISAKVNNKHKLVKPIQKRLTAMGYRCFTAGTNPDGIAGPRFTEAVNNLQKTWTKNPDGEITAKNKTWKKLLGMI